MIGNYVVKRTKEQAFATRSRILQAAVRLFRGKSWSDVTLADVAMAAGVTRGAVYWHFADKNGLIREVYRVSSLPSELLAIECGCTDNVQVLETLRANCLETLAAACADAGDAVAAYAEPSSYDELVDPGASLLDRYSTALPPTRLYLESALSIAVERGQLPRELDTMLAARILHGTLTGLTGEWLLAPTKLDLLYEAGRALDAVFNMVERAIPRRLHLS